MTAQQLADRIGLDLRQVQRFEGEEGNPTLETLVRLSEAMDLAPVVLVLALETEVRANRPHTVRARRAVDAKTRAAAPPEPPPSSPLTDTATAVEQVAHAIRSRRSARDWTQNELADRAGLSRSKVQSIEGRHHAATLDTLDALATALDCAVVELVGGERSAKR